MTAKVLASALAFARHGFAVVPLNWPTSEGRLRCSCGKSQCPAPAKHPHGKLAPRGLLSATTEPDILKHWFAVSAPQANLGVVTNELSCLTSIRAMTATPACAIWNGIIDLCR